MSESKTKTNIGEYLRSGLDVGWLQPVLNEHGNSVVKVEGRWHSSPTKARMTMAQWFTLDRIVGKAVRSHCPAVQALIAAGLVLGDQRGMSKMVLEPEEMEDAEQEQEEHEQTLTGLREGIGEKGKTFQVQGLPLPLTYKDFKPDFEMEDWTIEGVLAGHRVGEALENMLLRGWKASEPKAGFSVQGLKWRFTSWTRASKSSLLKGVLYARDLLYSKKFYGPYLVLASDELELRPEEGIGSSIVTQEGIQTIVTCPRLGPGEMVLAQVTPDVVRLVIPLEPTVVQWEDHFMVVACVVPQVRSDFHGACGIAVIEVGV